MIPPRLDKGFQAVVTILAPEIFRQMADHPLPVDFLESSRGVAVVISNPTVSYTFSFLYGTIASGALVVLLANWWLTAKLLQPLPPARPQRDYSYLPPADARLMRKIDEFRAAPPTTLHEQSPAVP